MMAGKLEQLRRNLATAEAVVAGVQSRIEKLKAEGAAATDGTAFGGLVGREARVEISEIRRLELPAAMQGAKRERERLERGQAMRDKESDRCLYLAAYRLEFGSSIREASATFEKLQSQMANLPSGFDTRSLQTVRAFLRQCQGQMVSLDHHRQNLAAWDGDIPPDHGVTIDVGKGGADPIRLGGVSNPTVAHIERFLGERMHLANGYHVGNRKFRRVYRRWCNDHQIKALRGQGLADALEPFGVLQGRFYEGSKRLRGWKGAMIKA